MEILWVRFEGQGLIRQTHVQLKNINFARHNFLLFWTMALRKKNTVYTPPVYFFYSWS